MNNTKTKSKLIGFVVIRLLGDQKNIKENWYKLDLQGFDESKVTIRDDRVNYELAKKMNKHADLYQAIYRGEKFVYMAGGDTEEQARENLAKVMDNPKKYFVYMKIAK